MAGSVFDTLGDAFKQAGDAFAQALNGGSSQPQAPAPAPSPAPDIHVEVKPGQAAGAIPVECPKCGAAIQQSGDRAATFCSYCGTRLLVDDGSAKVTYTTVDETRIRELEAQSALELKQLELEEKRRPIWLKLMAALAVAGVLFIIVGAFAKGDGAIGSNPWATIEILGVFMLLADAYIGMLYYVKNDSRNSDGKDD